MIRLAKIANHPSNLIKIRLKGSGSPTSSNRLRKMNKNTVAGHASTTLYLILLLFPNLMAPKYSLRDLCSSKKRICRLRTHQKKEFGRPGVSNSCVGFWEPYSMLAMVPRAA